MRSRICVFASSAAHLEPVYYQAASQLGELLASDHGLVYGGGAEGLMGSLAKSYRRSGGKDLTGILPRLFDVSGVYYEQCDTLIFTDTMHERKAQMEAMSDAYIALPGGFGTYEELLEVITLKQLRYHNKPIVILNIADSYSGLLAQFRSCIKEKFAKEVAAKLYYATDDASDAIAYIKAYAPVEYPLKWAEYAGK